MAAKAQKHSKNSTMKLKYILAAVVVGALALVATPKAEATASLRISDGTTTVTISDNAAGDLDGSTGSILFNSAVNQFAGWTISMSLGVTKPLNGAANFPIMEMNFTAIYNNASAGSTLTIQFTDTDFTGPSPTSFGATYGGNVAAGASLVYTTYRDNNNNPFADGADADTLPDAGTLISTSPTYTGTQGGTQWTPMLSNTNPYSLTEQIVLTQSAGLGRTNSGDATLQTPDGGFTAALLGFGFLGLAGIRRKLMA